ncbi:MAG: NAD-dependent epimerase/dehydratase family protein [Planctomycetes bacterium]|nr:NAD-dependent epimerase/dehydratase family protein [Planctomycetota bacterium]
MYLVTGASGFVGSAIAVYLANKGFKVRNIDIRDPDYTHPNIEFVRGDIRNVDDVKNALKDIEYVFHNAALVPLTKAGKDFFGTNVLGTKNMIEESLSHKVKKFIHTSSSSLYGRPEQCPITLKTPFAPIETYGKSKTEAEHLVLSHRGKGMDIVSIRPRTILGTNRLGIFDLLFSWISEGYNIPIIGTGNNLLQFVHIDDIVQCAYRSSLIKGNYFVFNVGAPSYGTLRGDLEKLITYGRSESRVISLPPRTAIAILSVLDKVRLSPLAPWHYLTYHRDFYFEISHIRDVLGWQPEIPNDQMFREAYDWYVHHKNERARREGLSIHKRPLKQKILNFVKRFV